MKYNILLLLLGFCFFYNKSYADNNLADSCYCKGVEYYKQKNYVKALECFEICDSVNNSIERKRPFYSSNSLAWITRCYYLMGDSVKSEKLLSNTWGMTYRQEPVDQRIYIESDSIAHLVDLAEEEEDYAKALSLIDTLFSIEEKVLEPTHNYIANTYIHKGILLGKIGDNKRALMALEKSAMLWIKNDCHSPNTLYYIFSFVNNYPLVEVIDTYEKVLSELNNVAIYDYTVYLDILTSYAEYYKNIGEYNKSIKKCNEVLDDYEQLNKQYTVKYFNTVMLKATNSIKLSKYDDALQSYSKALEVAEKLGEKENAGYGLLLCQLGYCHMLIGNYDESLKYYNNALVIVENSSGKESLDYAHVLNNLSGNYSVLGNYIKAIELNVNTLKIYEKIYGKENIEYITTLNNLASNYREIGNYSGAVKIHMENLKTLESIVGKENPYYASSLSNLASNYSALGNYSESIKLNKEVLKIRDKILGREHPEYAISLINLATDLYSEGKYSEAVRLNLEALQIQEKVYGKDHPEYVSSLSNLASNYSVLGKYSESIKLNTEALQIREKIFGKEHPDYATSLNNLASDYSTVGNYSESIKLNTEALQIREKIFGKEHPDYAMSLNNLASDYSTAGNYSESIKLNTEALQIREKIFGKEHSDYATSLNNLASDYSNVGNYSEAIKLNTEALQIREKIFSKEHPRYIEALFNSASIEEKSSNIEKFLDVQKQYLILKIRNIVTTTQTLTPHEQEMFWEEKRKELEYGSYNRTYKYNNPEFNKLAYNSTLLMKGFLLGAQVETKKIIQESGDESVKSLYDDILMNKQMLEKLYEKPIAERFISTDSLEDVIQKQERELAIKSAEYGSIMHNMSITWKDVQKKLKKDDIAIEFVSFPISNDSIMYIAYTLKKEYASPKLTTLFVEKQLSSINPNRYYGNNKKIYNLVWAPLEEELKGVNNVYFSPTGELYNINIEVLPEIAQVDEKRNYYRLSSTRELALMNLKARKNNHKAVVYGGMRYDASENALGKAVTVNSDSQYQEDNVFHADSIKLRSGWSYLPGTLAEAKTVDKALRESEQVTELYVDTIGTEASFKALSGQGRKLIHIATHGFFYMDKDSIKMEQEGFRMITEGTKRRKQSVEDKSLTRSGMLFTGCNNILTGKTIPEGSEDGILYGKEIAQMDLRGLDHITLSACETGLGDITGEGVFGLQRAFKKAGAHSILMTLWKVDDDATRMLMSRFYNNYLTKKMPKVEALNDARDYIRNYEAEIKNSDGSITKFKKYQEPKYWAAFIILDGI